MISREPRTTGRNGRQKGTGKMGTRKIITIGDETLRKVCKKQEKFDLRLAILLKDMADTMYKAEGVGLAAPQVGVLKRIFVMDCSADRSRAMAFINPEILETEGEQTGEEGCLSVPGKHATVTRPMKVTVRALNEEMEEVTLTLEGLEARCVLHENDHLDGILYVDKAESPLVDNEE